MGVVSGIVMSYQFGTNWAVFSDKAGPVIGPLMAYEVLTAFFLEAGFLGVMLFGMEKVGKRLHFAATLMVALGTFVSAFWILSVNSWMQTPTGYVLGANGQFLPGESWAEIIFNPSFPYRLVHTVMAAYLTTAFVVGAVGAWHLLKDRANPHARKMFSMAMWMAAIVTPAQIFAGDMHGLNTLEHQPAKVMAMEGHYRSHPDGAPLILFGIPDSEAKTVRYAIEIPKLSSLILKHDPDAPLAGLDTIPDDREPPVGTVFWSFRIMVGIGFAMLGIGLWSLWGRFRGTLYDLPWLHRAAVLMGPSGFAAVLAGWITTEVGRQPSWSMACSGPPMPPARLPRLPWLHRCSPSSWSTSPSSGSACGTSSSSWARPRSPANTASSAAMSGRSAPPGSPPGRRRTRAGKRLCRQKRSPDRVTGSLRDGSHDRLGLYHRLCGLRLCGDGRL